MNKNHKEILKRNLLFFFENIVVDKLKKFSTQKEFGYHGLEHTELVALRAIDIAVDGGINLKTAPRVKKAGANILVAGTAILMASDYKVIIDELKEEN